MREKIKNIISNYGSTGITEEDYEFFVEKVTDQILKTLIESLPEEKHKDSCLSLKDGYGHKFSDCDCGANYKNSYRSEVINLLRGTR